MKLKILLALSFAFYLIINQDSEEGADSFDSKDEDNMLWGELEKVTPQELQKLEGLIKKSLHYKDKDLIKTLNESFRIEELKNFPDEVRLIADKVLLQYLYQLSVTDTDTLKVFVIQNYSCIIPTKEEVNQPIWEISYQHVKELRGLLSDFSEVISKWNDRHGEDLNGRMNSPNDYVPSQTQQAKASVSDLKERLEDFMPKFLEFRKKVGPWVFSFPCTIKNYMSFLDILHRFHRVYKKTSQGYTRDVRFLDLAECMKDFYSKFKIFQQAYIRISMWVLLINEFQFFSSKEETLEVYYYGDDFLHKLVNSIAEIIQKVCRFTEILLIDYQEVKKDIVALEEAAGIKPHRFPNIEVIACGTGLVAARILALVLVLFTLLC